MSVRARWASPDRSIRVRARAHPPIRSRIPNLIPAGRELADIAETPMTVLVSHQAAPSPPRPYIRDRKRLDPSRLDKPPRAPTRGYAHNGRPSRTRSLARRSTAGGTAPVVPEQLGDLHRTVSNRSTTPPRSAPPSSRRPRGCRSFRLPRRRLFVWLPRARLAIGSGRRRRAAIRRAWSRWSGSPGLTGSQAYRAGLRCRNPSVAMQPVLPVGPVIGQRLAGPFARGSPRRPA